MKIAIVTGASSGMGREFVRQLGYFYKNLDEIWVIARRKERLEALAKESRVPLRIFAGDLQKKKVYKELRDALEKEQPDLRMLVNSAGFGKSGSVEEILSEKFRIQTDMVDVNFRETAEYLEETDNGEGRQSGSSGVEGLQIREVSLRLWNPNEINLLWNKTAAAWISRAYATNMNLE